jgi:hypothetical protein
VGITIGRRDGVRLGSDSVQRRKKALTSGVGPSAAAGRKKTYPFGVCVMLGRGQTVVLGWKGFPLAFSRFLFFFSFFLFCFALPFCQKLKFEKLKPYLNLSQKSLCLVNFRKAFEIERQPKLK